MKKYLTLIIVLLILRTSPVDAQPNSPDCKNAKELVQSLISQIAALRVQKNSGLYSGSASTVYERRMQQLNNQLSEANILEHKVCSNNYMNTQAGYVFPRFLVLSVIYAPPGSRDTISTSYIDYGSSSKLGSSVSASHSFKRSAGVTVTAGYDVMGSGASVSVGYNGSNSQTDKSQIDLKKSEQLDIKVTGPSVDGVDHNKDQIWFWVEPTALVTISAEDINWSLNNNDIPIQYLTVGQLHKFLNDSSTVDRDDVGKQLKAIGFTQSDYKSMISVDPFWNGISPIDTMRFTRLAENFVYEPVSSAGDGTTIQTYNIMNEAMYTSSYDGTISNDLKVSVTASAGFGGYKVSATADFEWIWTNETTNSSSADNTQSSTLAIGQPSSTYQGYTNIAVYWDRIWQSFLFVPIPLGNSIILTGNISNKDGKPIPYAQVTLNMGAYRMITYANRSGHYTFYVEQNKSTRNAVIVSANTRKNIVINSHPTSVNLRTESLK